ncbi:hypothetical protein [Natribacillus halophilus]|nr:hypothetical protein [Natribacillus halophilus]
MEPEFRARIRHILNESPEEQRRRYHYAEFKRRRKMRKRKWR